MKPIPTCMIPRPLKRDRPSQKRKRQITKLDRQFQNVPAKARCVVPGCPRKPGKHHRIKRRYQTYRHDDKYAMLLCWSPHHTEIEQIGEKAFCLKYGLQLPVGLPAKFTPRI